MFGDVADTRDNHHPGKERQKPQQRISPPHTRRSKSGKEKRVGDNLRAQFAPEMRGSLRDRPGFVAECIDELRLALREAGLTAYIAPEFPPIALPSDWKGC
jgi:hypothetical protein